MPPSLEKLAVHTFTNRPWTIRQCVEAYARRGIGGVSIWRETVEGCDLAAVRAHLADAGLEPVSYVRGGFFTGATAEDRAAAVEENLRCIAEAEALGTDKLVLVCGATPQQTPRENLGQIAGGIAAIAPAAADAGLRLLIEPLHPMYAGDRSAVASMKTANDLADQLGLPGVGVAVDVYHVWWEPDLGDELTRCAEAGRLDAYHVCDFLPELEHPLLDRGLMGEGCIALGAIDRMVRGAGFTGFIEVEIFSQRWWARDQDDFLDAIVRSYLEHYPPPPITTP